eukprot:PLAT7295.3.p1 GENE.PLAT7295.3~~PLAT7295.3.p1  ORF type:complete len:356 (+),score=88.66 PLAT7295.3:38-1069(+)
MAYNCCSKYATLLRNAEESVSVHEYVDGLKKNPCQLTLHASAYHKERRTTGSGKNRRTRTVTVTTWRDSQTFAATEVIDFSQDVNSHGRNQVRLTLAASYDFADEYTRQVFDLQCRNMQAIAATKDRYTRFSVSLDIPGFKSALLGFVDPSKRPTKLSFGWYYLACVFLLAVPYRMWMEGLSSADSISINKRFKLGRGGAGAAAVETMVCRFCAQEMGIPPGAKAVECPSCHQRNEVGPKTTHCCECRREIGVPPGAEAFQCPYCGVINHAEVSEDALGPAAPVVGGGGGGGPAGPETASCIACGKTIGVPPGASAYACPLCGTVNHKEVMLEMEPSAPPAYE